jgi:hypothetical protein
VRRPFAGRLLVRPALLVAALAALIVHVCALESARAGHAGAAPASHHGDPGGAGPDLHAASCDGIKPASLTPHLAADGGAPLLLAGLAPIGPGRRPVPAAAVSRPARYLLHGSLLI